MKKSAWIDFLVCFLFGCYGVHKFREKKIGIGLLYLFTFGLLTFGWIFDCVVYLYKAISITCLQNETNEEFESSIYLAKAKKIAWIVVIACIVLFFIAGACTPSVEQDDLPNNNAGVIVDQTEQQESDKNSQTSVDDVEESSDDKKEEEDKSDVSDQPVGNEQETPTQTDNTKEEQSEQEPSIDTHIHSFTNATCTEAKKCSCGVTEGEPLGHSWKNATCTAPKTCETCNAIEGSNADHSWTAATCTAPQKCRTCSLEKGSATGHNYSKGTCTICGSKDPNHSEITYILNEETKKFHHTTCWKLPVDNRSDSTLSRDEIVAQGYSPCGLCKP